MISEDTNVEEAADTDGVASVVWAEVTMAAATGAPGVAEGAMDHSSGFLITVEEPPTDRKSVV